jgi:hypothetical protein
MCFEPLPQAGGGGGVQCCARFIGNKKFFCIKKDFKQIRILGFKS